MRLLLLVVLAASVAWLSRMCLRARSRVQSFVLAVALSLCALATWMFFVRNYRQLDALMVLAVVMGTIAVGAQLARRKLR